MAAYVAKHIANGAPAVLFVSGYMDDDQREQVVRRQPRSRFLPKPFTMGQLAHAVSETIALSAPVLAEPDR